MSYDDEVRGHFSRSFILSSRILLSLLNVIGVSACSPLLNVGNYDEHHDQTRDSSFLINQNCPLEFKKYGYCAELVWDQSRVRSNSLNSMSLHFWKKTSGAKPLGNFNLDPSIRPQVWLWMDMSEGGHGSSPVRVTQSTQSGGEFAVDEVVFSMRGKWQIHVDLVESSRSAVDSALIPIWISR